MRESDVYWHVYPLDQIKPRLRGNLIFILALPANPASPIIRDVLDPTGREFPVRSSLGVMDFADKAHHGIVYNGVSKEAVYDIVSFDPRIRNTDLDYAQYNRQVVSNSREFFLSNTDHRVAGAPEQTTSLLDGTIGAKSDSAIIEV